VGIIFLGMLLRIGSLTWNTFPHADVKGDTSIIANFIKTGRLWGEPPDSSALRHPSLFSADSRLGVPSLQHGPVWQVLGGGLSMLWRGSTIADAFLALRILSVLSGTAMIFLLWKVAKMFVHPSAALVCALWASLSFLLIDYSGNGAFYALQGSLYLVWILLAMRPSTHRRAVMMGALAGLAYLVNYQAIILLPISIVLAWFPGPVRFRDGLLSAIIFTVAMSLVASPWLIRNAILVGDPFAHHLVNSGYIFSKSGISSTVIDYVYHFPSAWERYSAILAMMITSWLPNNAFYIARKLFILAPIAFIFMSYGLIDQVLSSERRRKLLPVLLLFAAHALISAAWPVTKFRYFVPLLPLVFVLSAEALEHFFPRVRTRVLWYALITVAVVLCSFLTFLSVPTHTYYYDGAITTDPFSSRGEWNFLRDNSLLSPS